MERKIKTFIALLLLVVSTSSMAKDFKVGAVSMEELQMESYAADPDAPAVVLNESTSVYTAIIAEKLTLCTTRHIRIKIFKKEGYDYADFDISLYDGTYRKDFVSDFKAYTFNINDGEVEKVRLKHKDVIVEKVTEYWKRESFSMPAVREGSVIDVQYITKRPLGFTVGDKNMQYSIPVVHADYTLKLPEWLDYQQSFRGYETIKADNPDVVSEMMFFNNTTQNVQSKVYGYQVDSIPAFKEEPFMTTKNNFITKVIFELRSVQIPGYPIESFTHSWVSVGNTLLLDNDFGGQIKKGHLKKEAQEIMAQTTDMNERLVLAVKKIQSLMRYNGKNNIVSKYDNISMAIKKGEGNSADMNLNLIAMLRKMDFDVKAVVLSTRKNGLILPYQATLDALNYVIAFVEMDEEYIFLDATDPLLPVGTLPFRCLNGQGVLLEKDRSKLVALGTNEQRFQVSTMMLNFSEGKILGSVRNQYNGYTATDKKRMMKLNGEEKYQENIMATLTDWSVSDLQLNQLEASNKPLTEKYSIEKPFEVTDDMEVLYLDAMYGDYLDENPFKVEERKFPVDYGCQQVKQYQVIITLPEGYAVESVPETKSVGLPENGGLFQYVVQQLGNRVVIKSIFRINKPMFSQIEYQMLKRFYQDVADTYNEKIVLKKN